MFVMSIGLRRTHQKAQRRKDEFDEPDHVDSVLYIGSYSECIAELILTRVIHESIEIVIKTCCEHECSS